MPADRMRTPKRNVKLGKDHWPHTSQLWFGAGVKGGTVVGASGTEDGNILEAQKIDLAPGEATESGEYNKYDNIVAGLLSHMWIDPFATGHFDQVQTVPFTAATANPTDYSG